MPQKRSTGTFTIVALHDGSDGYNTYVVRLYKRQMGSLSTPDRPSISLWYKFSTQKLYTDADCTTEFTTSTTGGNGWGMDIPAAETGKKIYVTCATAYAQGDVDKIEVSTSPAVNEWSTPVPYNENGSTAATVVIYKRAASQPLDTPTKDAPTDGAVYAFADNSLVAASGGSLNGWSTAFPDSNGQPCWRRQATALSNDTTDTIDASEWSEASKEVKDGENGVNGQDMRENLIDNSEARYAIVVGVTPANGGTSPAADSNGLRRYDIGKTFDPERVPDDTPLSGQMKITFDGCSFGNNANAFIFFNASGSYPQIARIDNPTNGTHIVKKENFVIASPHNTYDGKARLCLTNFNDGGTVTVERVKLEVGEKCSAWCLSENDKKGTPGQSSYKSSVFCRSNTTPDTPSNAAQSGYNTYASPVPPPVSGQPTWSDGIPGGTAKIWESTRIFTSDGLSPQQSAWTTPREMTDTQSYDVEFAFEQTNDAQPAAPVDGTGGNRHGCVPASNQIWFDPVLDATSLPSGKTWSDMVWRAERETNNGVQSGWTVSRIKAEHTIVYEISCGDVVKPGDATMTVEIRKTVDGTATTGTPSAMDGTLAISGGGTINQQTGVVTLPTITESTQLTLTYTVGGVVRATKVVRGVKNGNDSTVPGPNGKDGYTLLLEPNGVTITQDENKNYDITTNTPQYVTPKVTKGEGTTNLVTAVSISENKCIKDTSKNIVNAVVENTDSVHRLKVTGVASAAETAKYTQGYVVLNITADGKTFVANIPVAVNYLGTYVQTIWDDKKTEFAQEVTTQITESGAFVTNDSTYQSVVNAAQTSQEWINTVNTPAATVANYNTRISNAEGNISTITKKVNDGKNLLTGVLTGTGWMCADSSDYTRHALTRIEDEWFYVNSGDAYIVSPEVSVEQGKYTLSFDTPYGPSTNVNVQIRKASDVTVLIASGSATSASGTRKSVKFTFSAADDVYVYIASERICHPQLESGEYATEFVASSVETSSQIKQTASEIDLSIRSGLNNTGINITNQTINLQADKVTFSDAQGGNTDKIQIDPTTGTMRMVNAVITGATMIDSVKTFESWSLWRDYNTQHRYIYDQTLYQQDGVDYLSKIWLLGTKLIFRAAAEYNENYTYKLVIHLPPAEYFKGQTILIDNSMFIQNSGIFTKMNVVLRADLEEVLLNKSAWDDGDVGDTVTENTLINSETGRLCKAEGVENWLTNGIFCHSIKNGYYFALMQELDITDFEWVELTAWENYAYNTENAFKHSVEWKVIRWSKD